MRTLVLVAISLSAGTAWSLALGATAQPAASSDGVINLPCGVQLNEIDGEALVPAEEAGKLTQIGVRSGQQVKAGDLLANIDDTQARKQKDAAESEYRAADEKASSTVDVEAATKAERVAALAYQSYLDSNAKVSGTVTKNDVEQKKFEWQKMQLAIEQARHQKVVDGFTANAKKAESELAQNGIERREIRAPFDGVIQEIRQHKGEWVKPGDPVLRMIRLDRLSVQGRANGTLYNPAEFADRLVTVQVTLAGGRKVEFPGKIVFVESALGVGDSSFWVRAEVENRKENGQWVLLPNMEANMVVKVK
jgi:RND family efflux transporter MFP subunit